MASQTSANTNGLDTLWMENGTVASPTDDRLPADAGDARAEGWGDAWARAGM